uniref:ribosomal protein L24 n=1 Tax=Catenella fusiformis TaxID=3024791 RepID=UPI0027DA2C58|nr:ribosomal protein L24 [Catenella fusiformis]WCH57571.1 ribosomal protein L24 [Catenella fusiformis]
MKLKRPKTHVKKGDYVQIITGADKGKKGKILKVIYKKQKVIVENINIKTKHIQPKQEGTIGEIIQRETPIHSSNVMLYSSTHKVASRYKYRISENKIKQKILIKTNEAIT